MSDEVTREEAEQFISEWTRYQSPAVETAVWVANTYLALLDERDALLRERDLLLADREALVCERDRLREEHEIEALGRVFSRDTMSEETQKDLMRLATEFHCDYCATHLDLKEALEEIVRQNHKYGKMYANLSGEVAALRARNEKLEAVLVAAKELLALCYASKEVPRQQSRAAVIQLIAAIAAAEEKP